MLMGNRRRNRSLLVLAVAILPALCGACAARRAALVDANTRVLKVKVTRDGDVYLDGQLKTVEEAEAELARLKRERGAVLYYREENAQHQPHPNALKLIHKIEELQLPIGLSEKDFE
jgi:biopolymer transport protein ExbD